MGQKLEEQVKPFEEKRKYCQSNDCVETNFHMSCLIVTIPFGEQWTSCQGYHVVRRSYWNAKY